LSTNKSMMAEPHPVQTYGTSPLQETLTQELLATMLQGAISAPSTLTILVEHPAMPIPPKPPYFPDKISPNFGIISAETSDTSLLTTPLIHAGCKMDIPQQNHVQRGKSNSLWQRELATRSITSTTTVATSNARLLEAIATLELLNLTNRHGPTMHTQATALGTTTYGYICHEHQDSWETGSSALQPNPGDITPTGHLLNLTKREDDVPNIHCLAPVPRSQVQTNHYVAIHSPMHNEDQLRSNPRMTQLPANWHNHFANQVLPETPDLTMMKWQEMRQFHSGNAIWLFPQDLPPHTTTAPEESVLVWTLFQPTLDTPWQHTYAWNAQLDGLVQAIDNSNFQSTF